MHEDLSRPLRAAADEDVCGCTCAASVREGEEKAAENLRQTNYLATKNKIGG